MRAVGLILLLLLPSVAYGQSFETTARVAAFNVVGHAVVGGVGALLRGDDFIEGVKRGAEAGGVVFAGKWVASRRSPWAQAPGRLIGQVGASMLRNSLTGRDRLERITLLIGPVVLDFEDGLHVRPDLGVIAYTIVLGARNDLHFDVGVSLRHLAIGFVQEAAPDSSANSVVWGSTGAGQIWVRTGADECVHAHEAVHLIQFDVEAIAFTYLIPETLDLPFSLSFGRPVSSALEMLSTGLYTWTEPEAFGLAGFKRWDLGVYNTVTLWDLL